MARFGLRLDPVRFVWPGARRLARWGLVAALLALAAGILYTDPGGCGEPSNPATTRETATGDHRGAAGAAPGDQQPPAAEPPGSGLSTSAVPTPAVPTPAVPSAAVPSAAVPPGMAAMTVRLADPATVAVLRPGAQVDLVAAGAGPPIPAVVLASVPGVAFEDPAAAAAFVAIPPDAARELANTPIDLTFRVIVRSM